MTMTSVKTMSTITDPHLGLLQSALTIAAGNMTHADLMRRPAGGKWNAAEIFEHLSLTYRATIRNLERNLRAEKPLQAAPTFRQRLRIMLVVDLGHFPRGRESPQYALPKGIPPEQLLGEMQRGISDMDGVMVKCRTKFGDNTLANHPILGPMTMRQWCKFHWVHGRHHLRQISRMRNQISWTTISEEQ